MSRLLVVSIVAAALGLVCWWYGFVAFPLVWSAVQDVAVAIWNTILLPILRTIYDAISTGKS
jgi:hypothetical protein